MSAFVLCLPCVGFLRLVQAVVTMKTRAEQVLFGLTLSAAHGFDDVEGDGAGRLALLLHADLLVGKESTPIDHVFADVADLAVDLNLEPAVFLADAVVKAVGVIKFVWNLGNDWAVDVRTLAHVDVALAFCLAAHNALAFLRCPDFYTVAFRLLAFNLPVEWVSDVGCLGFANIASHDSAVLINDDFATVLLGKSHAGCHECQHQ